MTDPSTDPTAPTGEMNIRERGKAERRLRVVETAVRILAAGGVESLSMRTLSASLEPSSASVSVREKLPFTSSIRLSQIRFLPSEQSAR